MFAENLKKARINIGLSQEALAEKIAEILHDKLSTQAVQKWEKGSSVPTRDKWAAVEESLGMPEGWVFALTSAVTTHTFTGLPSASVATSGGSTSNQQVGGSGNSQHNDNMGIVINHGPAAPAGIDAQDFDELIAWLTKHPSMVKAVLAKAREIGTIFDQTLSA